MDPAEPDHPRKTVVVGGEEDPPERCPRCEGYAHTYHTYKGACTATRKTSR
jgi:hypothetical protein